MDSVVDGVRLGDLACVELSVEYIESDVMTSGSGCLRERMARSPRHADLNASQQRRLAEVFLAQPRQGTLRKEFKEYIRLFSAHLAWNPTSDSMVDRRIPERYPRSTKVSYVNRLGARSDQASGSVLARPINRIARGGPMANHRSLFALLAVGTAATLAMSADAAVIKQVYVGTLSNSFANDAHPSGLTRGGKYVVRTSFDTDDMILVPAAQRNTFAADTYVVQLTDDPAATGATNTYELFLPSEGYGDTLTQTGRDHFLIGPGFAPTAEVQFFSNCGSAVACADAFRGFEFESNFLRSNSPNTPASGSDLVFEQFTADVNIGGTGVTNYGVNVLDEGLNNVVVNAGHLDVLSASGSPSGGQLNPGVFFGEAVEVVAEAGPTPLVYSATNLTLTTSAGTEQVTDPVIPPTPGTLRKSPSAIDQQPRQADNDLGAGRSDGEDFLAYTWTVGGSTRAGDQAGTRLDRIVDTLVVSDPSTQPHGAYFVTQGTRGVDNVNIAVAIQDSGLTTTTDTTTFDLRVDEAYTGKTDTDSVGVSYINATPTIGAAGATEVVDGLLFVLDIQDPDLTINSLIPDFEVLATQIIVDTIDVTGFFAALLGTGSQFVDQAALLSEFGVGSHLFDVFVEDRAMLASTSTPPLQASFSFDVALPNMPQAMPLPPTLALLLGGLAGLVGYARRRRPLAAP